MRSILSVSASLLLCISIMSCGKSKDFDGEDRLLLTALESSNGEFAFKPMQQRDSNAVMNYTTPSFTYKGRLYSGKIASYNDKDTLMIDGYLNDGIQDGNWKFYFASGVLNIEGTYKDGFETGYWTSYYRKDKPRIKMFYDEHGYMLMRTEYYDNGQIKNYQNIKCPQYGNRERRIQFTYDGKIDYMDAEREIGALSPNMINDMLQEDKLFVE